ncbi:MAG TPA: SDR family NAD(P)-dependent oxidoreductase [Anaerolineales bacterium]|nr:SDR family NAD(P)-dependent oxidoreductase [Anaerolineales bacterium]
MVDLNGKVAVVTGASRGVGKGIALGLGEAGATVYVTGRTTQEGTDIEKLGGTVFATAEEVTALGGQGIPVPCDHRDDAQVEQLFQLVKEERGRLDILVNNAWGGYEQMEHDGEFTWLKPFWSQPFWRWDAMFQGGVRAAYVASALAARLMIEQKNGLIVHISFWAAQKYIANVAYGAAKAAVDKMTADMAHEAKDFNIAVVSLYPGLVRTESVLRAAENFDMSNSESPQFTGRVIAALANDPNLMNRTGKVWVGASLAEEYGIQDIDGKRPRPVTREEA